MKTNKLQRQDSEHIGIKLLKKLRTISNVISSVIDEFLE